MVTDYNRISQEYKQAKLAPWRIHVEQFTLFELIGDVRGKSVLDLACGEGFLSRELKSRDARRVVGVDISQAMIDLARSQEQSADHGIEYRVSDVKELVLDEQFDLVVAGWLLNYARTPDELLAMCQSIARHLKLGGRFCTINNDFENPPANFERTRPHGFIRTAPDPIAEGDTITWTIFLPDRSFTIDNYYLSRPTHEKAFTAAGLKNLKFHPPRLSPSAGEAGDETFWAAFLDHAPAAFLEAIR